MHFIFTFRVNSEIGEDLYGLVSLCLLFRLLSLCYIFAFQNFVIDKNQKKSYSGFDKERLNVRKNFFLFIFESTLHTPPCLYLLKLSSYFLYSLSNITKQHGPE